MAKVAIPTPLRPYTNNQSEVVLAGTTVKELLANLTGNFPNLSKHIFAEDGVTLRHFVNIYVNDDDIRHLQGPQTTVKETDLISIIPSIAGGSI